MGFDVDLKPEGKMLFIKNKDVPGVIGKIGTILGNCNVNIAGYLLSRIDGSDFAYAVIKLDEVIDGEVLEEINSIKDDDDFFEEEEEESFFITLICHKMKKR